MAQNSTESMRHERPSSRRRNASTAADLVATGVVTAQQAYAATLVLARLHDRRVALSMTLEEMCEVLGYVGDGRRPKCVPADRVVPSSLRGVSHTPDTKQDRDG